MAAEPSDPVHGGNGPLEAILGRRALYPVFQPIVSLSQTDVYAHEALIRGPQGTELHTPDALLLAAADENLNFEFEFTAIDIALQAWGQVPTPGRLFVNISANALMHLLEKHTDQYLADLLRRYALNPRMLVLEITEHERVSDMDHLIQVVESVRQMGAALALDDFGDGRSSLRLWSQIKPEFVKIDKYFTRNLHNDGSRVKTIEALQQIAVIFGSQLIAEGVETEQELRVLRDMGISYGQGYFLGYPSPQPATRMERAVVSVLRENSVTVFPELKHAAANGQIRNISVMPAPAVKPDTSNNAVAAIFSSHPELHAIAVLNAERPVGIINRSLFMNEFSKQYYREICGGKACFSHANAQPRVIERDHSVDQLVGILTSQDQRYLADGFVVTENGRYVGLGTGEQLVRSVTEARIEAARHANPLTFLPGNIPISQHIERLLARKSRFVACYADLNNFKPFNDYYGYWRGDEMIRLLAQVCMEHCDTQQDFLGHVGGDDFILLFQSADWSSRCKNIVEKFNVHAKGMYDAAAREAGGIEAEDRQGVRRFFPFTSLSIGVVRIDGSQYTQAHEVANLAALAKHDAKLSGAGVVERAV